jgi:microcystin-dependent protein
MEFFHLVHKIDIMIKNYFISFVLFFSISNASAQSSDLPYIAEIKIFAGSYVPRGWAECNGQLLTIQQNQVLFSIIGTYYGGDGIRNFALPDLRGRVVIGKGSTNSYAQNGGVEAVTISQAQMPAHQHNVPIVLNSVAGTLNVPVAGVTLAKPVLIAKDIPREALGYTTNVPDVPLAGTPTTIVGASIPLSSRQPSLGLVYIIATEGIFPSRN